MAHLKLDPSKTALVVIDLQRGILARATEPRPSDEVLTASVRLVESLRAAGGFVVCVRVSFSDDMRDRLSQETDEPAVGAPPAGWDELDPRLGLDRPSTHILTKRNWGAFYGTDLDLQLRRRGIDTVVLCGIATNYGVESTARNAYEHGYRVILVEDAMASMAEADHRFAVTRIFPRIGRVVTTAEVVAALK